MEDIRYIRKCFLIGVLIGIILYLLKGKFVMQTYAESYNYVPNDIIIASDYNTQYSTTSYTWWNDTYYGFPSNTPTDWPPSYTNIYFRYPQFNGSTLCSSTANNGSISGVLANGSMNIDTTPYVRFEDTLNTVYTSCASSYSGQLLTFTCNNVNLSHGVNIVVSNPNPGVWAIKRQLNINCSMTNEGLAQNANQNTQNIINNNNQNTQNIINNQNENTDKEIDSQKVCKFIDKSAGVYDGYLTSSGTTLTDSYSVVSDYYSVVGSIINVVNTNAGNQRTCFYNSNKSFISCVFINTIADGGLVPIPNNASYVRFTINKSANKPTFKICTNGNQALQDSLTDDNVSGANKEASSFFNSFTANNHGLSGIITAPLRLLNSLSSSICSSLTLPLPFVNENVVLPCMSTIYSTHFSSFLTLYRLITDGIISYWVLIKLFGHVKGMQNPEDDRIEVFDL